MLEVSWSGTAFRDYVIALPSNETQDQRPRDLRSDQRSDRVEQTVMKWIIGYLAVRCIGWLGLYCISLLVSGPLLGNVLEGLQSRMEISISLER
jgi:hypothetical protein